MSVQKHYTPLNGTKLILLNDFHKIFIKLISLIIASASFMEINSTKKGHLFRCP